LYDRAVAFSEKIRLQVRESAAFSCCRCPEIGVEVHHIVPAAQGGPDTFENAAPLCPNCHAGFGGNADKRKEIKQMRDRWYAVVAEKWPTGPKEQAVTSEDVEELRAKLHELSERLDQDRPAEITAGPISATRLADDVHTGFVCRNCNTRIGMLVGGAKECPVCHTPF